MSTQHRTLFFRFAPLLGVGLWACTPALRGECGEWDNRLGTPVGTYGDVHGITTWDPDATGPEPPQLVVGGRFGIAGAVRALNIARWNGVAWQAVGEGIGGGADPAVQAVATWDADGDGPLGPVLVVAGRFSTAGGTAAGNIAVWDGAEWRPLGGGLDGDVYGLSTYDADGPGPRAPALIAGGDFSTSSGMTVNHVSLWDGETWRAIGQGTNGTVFALTSWDPDDDGPAPPRIVAAGYFDSVDGFPASNIAAWDGMSWSPMGGGLNNIVRGLVAWDSDGSGPLKSRLVAGGAFSLPGEVATRHVAQWDGMTWQAMGPGLSLPVGALSTWDPDGPGSMDAQLLAAGGYPGSAFGRVDRWDGAGWRTAGSSFAGSVNAMTSWDADDAGPLPPEIAVGGRFDRLGGLAAKHVALWNGRAWRLVESGLDRTVLALTTWDPDGSGPVAEQLVAGGLFSTAGGGAAASIAGWTDSGWHSFGDGFDAAVNAVISFDPDEDGPQLPILVAASAGHVSAWGGDTWVSQGPLVSGAVHALAVWDPDQDGPLAKQLVAAGGFVYSSGAQLNRVARLDSGSWLPIGGGIGGGAVYALLVWDSDGSGPLQDMLVVGGRFTTAGGAAANNIALWDGAAWESLDAGTDNSVNALSVWDPDGSGGEGAQLVAGGTFSSAGSAPANHIARWDGMDWHPIGTGLGEGAATAVYAVTSWDPDGPGPSPAQIIAGGDFLQAEGATANHIARWDGSAWQPLGGGFDGLSGVIPSIEVRSLVVWNSGGAGPMHEQLVAGGGFTLADGRPSSNVALWSAELSGDMNCDCALTVSDIAGFVLAITSWTRNCDEYTQAFPDCACNHADLNGDGIVGVSDIGPFVERLNGG